MPDLMKAHTHADMMLRCTRLSCFHALMRISELNLRNEVLIKFTKFYVQSGDLVEVNHSTMFNNQFTTRNIWIRLCTRKH